MFKKTDLIAITVASVFALSVLGPAVAQAAPLTSMQIDAITNLLQAFGADPATIANVQAVLSGTGAAVSSTSTPSVLSGAPASSSGSCAVLSSNLEFGSEGEDVSRLQSFLSKDKSIYPEGLVTGYFGPATEDAVQRWQAAHGIVATGTPDTTGFGLVGPSTRGEMTKEMETECEGGDQGNATASSTDAHSGSGDN